MANYDFKTLLDYDFELLVRDLLQQERSITLESFKRGRDGGIDLRYAEDKKNGLIVQCKHYASSPLSTLMSHLRNKEAEKVRELEPERYVLATSLGLNQFDKEEIMEIFEPYIKSTADIYGATDLNNLLTKFPRVEQNHFKLWMNSIRLLQNVLHADVVNRSRLFINQVIEKAKSFVMFSTYEQAIEKLEHHHYCVITGQPGVGKTTLAESLALRYLKENFEPVKITTSVRDILSMYEEERKQFFIVDDFIGQTRLRDLFYRNEEDDLSLLLESIMKSPNKRLVMTSRDYIMREAFMHNEKLARSGARKSEFILNMSFLSGKERALLIYNHMAQIPLDPLSVHRMLDSKNYISVIEHRNFNPRIIEYTMKQDGSGNASSIIENMLTYMNNPEEIWQYAFKQLFPEGQVLLTLLVTMPQEMLYSDLKRVYEEYTGTSGPARMPFREILEGLENIFIDIETIRIKGTPETEYTIIKLQNPSIRDFLENRILSSFDEIEFICTKAVYLEQVVFLAKMLRGKAAAGLYIHLLTGFERTMDSKSANVQVTRKLDYNNVKVIKYSLEQRYIFIISEVKMMPQNVRTASFIAVLYNKLEEELSQYQGPFSDISDLVTYFEESNDSQFFQLQPHFKRILMDSLNEINEFSDLYSYDLPFSSEDQAEIRSRFLSVVDRDVMDYEQKLVESYLIYSYTDTLKRISKELNVGTEEAVRRLEERAQYLILNEHEVPNEYDWDDEPGMALFEDMFLNNKEKNEFLKELGEWDNADQEEEEFDWEYWDEIEVIFEQLKKGIGTREDQIEKV